MKDISLEVDNMVQEDSLKNQELQKKVDSLCLHYGKETIDRQKYMSIGIVKQ